MKKFLTGIVLSFCVAFGFAQTNTTPNISLQLPSRGSNNWNIPLQYNFSQLDCFLSGGCNVPNFSVNGYLNVGGKITANNFLLTSFQNAPCLSTDASGNLISGCTLGSGVVSFNSRSGSVTLSSSDVDSVGTISNPLSALQVASGASMDSNQGTGAFIQHSTGVVNSGHIAAFDSTGNTIDSGAASLSSFGLSRWSDKLQSVIKQIGNASVCEIGDSTVISFHSNNQTYGNFMPMALTTDLAELLSTKYGIPSTSYSFYGTGVTPSQDTVFGYLYNYGTALVAGTGWSLDSINVSIGGPTYTTSTVGTATANALAYTPEGPVDTFSITYLTMTNGGTLSATVDSGTPTTVNTAASTAGAGKLIVQAPTLGGATHTLYLSMSAGTEIWVVGVEAYDSTQKGIHIKRMGQGAATAAINASQTNSFSPGNSLIYQTIGCDVSFVEGGINDWQNAVSIPSFTSQINTIVSALESAGSDVIVEAPTPQQGYSVDGTMILYANALASVAASNKNAGASQSLPFINMLSLFDGPPSSSSYGWTNANSKSWMFTDGIHPNQYGYALMAASQANALMGLPANSLASPSVLNWTPNLTPNSVTITSPQTTAGVQNWITTSNGIYNTILCHGVPGTVGSYNDFGQCDFYGNNVETMSLGSYNGVWFNNRVGVAIGTSTVPSYGLSIYHNSNNSVYLTTTNGTNNTISLHSLSGSSDFGQIDLLEAGTVAVETSAYYGQYINSTQGGLTVGSTTLPKAGVINANVGYTVGGSAATSGHYLRGNGTNYVDSIIQAQDLANSTQTTVACSTSGSAVFSEPIAGSADKKVLIHLSACVGTASYTFPTAYANIPSVFASNNVTSSIITAVSTTAVTVTGTTTTTGSITLEDY